MNKIYHNDWMKNELSDKSVQLIIADPPYFEVKGEFDFVWKSFTDYLVDVERWALECKRLLADNGTLYWYGDAKRIAYAQIIFDKHFNLLNSIVWENTNDHKQQIRFNNDLRSYAPLTERFLMYGSEAMDLTGLQTVEMEYIAPRNPYAIELRKARAEKGISISKVAEFGKFYGKVNHGGAVTNWELGYNVPLAEQWKTLCENLPIKRTDYDELRMEYEALRMEYENKRRPFNNERHYGDVIRIPNYETGNYVHDTIKPEKLTRELILISSRPNDLVFVPFAGSGTECAMALKEGRNFIGFDTDEKYVKMGNDRCNAIAKTPSLF